ncbi:HlyD family secretion protein [Phorcysia thermohydrogeniphila]|uniref:Membrane fusion protein (Multidrug efflux system) n=1 Tax=Phorcysia thermohydrogeniphila TaxID=936138 RepID=A0A4R1GKA2_9BACT|nr:HlyD family secretion protein [Phorcysia thermohydrogeniphila]TCK06449.1 membrane fusion protein (multidrug efflux system) [Phorcysia thermohydrogeniphila]
MKKFSSLVGILLIGALTFWLGRYFYLRQIYVITDNAFQMADVVTVSTQDVSGKIVAMNAKEYDSVKKGDVLFKVDDSVYRKNYEELKERLSALVASKERLLEELKRTEEQLPLQVEIVRAKLRALQEKLNQLKKQKEIAQVSYETSVEKAKSSLKAAQEAVKAAETFLKSSKNKYERYSRLYKKRVISKEQFEEVENLYKKAKADYAAALSRLEAAKEDLKLAESTSLKVGIVERQIRELEEEKRALRENLKVSEADLRKIEELKKSIEQLSAQIRATEKALEKAKILLSHTEVRSPVSGLVAKKWREIGDFVSPGLPVYSVYDPSTFYVLAWIDEDKASYVKAGSPVKAVLEACGRELKGKVSSVGVSAGSIFSLIPRDTSQGEYTRVTQRVPVKILLDGVPPECIKPGTNVTVYIKR